jgi:hypothetical protein
LSLPYNPEALFWIAYYADGTCLPQYDPESSQEHLWKEVDQSRITALAWHPFTEDLAKQLDARDVKVSVNPFMRTYRVELQHGDTVILNREQKLNHIGLIVCLKCGYRWIFAAEKPPFIEYPWSSECRRMEDKNGLKYASEICPQCGAFTEYICPDCKICRSKYREGEDFVHRCDQCGKSLPTMIGSDTIEERSTVYEIGRETLGGSKHLIRVDEFGNVEVK